MDLWMRRHQVFISFPPNKFYKNDDEYLENLSWWKMNMKKSRQMVKASVRLPDLALARHMTFKDLSEKDF